MSKSENTPKSWDFIGIIQSIKSLPRRFFQFFSAPDNIIPDNEAGEFMRRYLQDESRIDHVCASWAKTPFHLKALYIALTISVFAVVGVVAGNPMLLALSGLALTLSINTLALAHEKQRFKSAGIFANELMEEKVIYREGQKNLDDTNKKLDDALERAKKDESEVNQQIIALETGQKKLEKATDILMPKVTEIDSQTTRLVLQQTEMNETVKQWADEINIGKKATATVTEKVQTVGVALEDIEKNKQKFSKAVSEFSIFVKNTPDAKAETNPALQQYLEMGDECDEFFKNLGWNSSTGLLL